MDRLASASSHSRGKVVWIAVRQCLGAAVAVLTLFPVSTNAQYKCVVDGRTIYAERPCLPGSKPMTLPRAAPVTDEDRAQAKAIAAQEQLLHEQNTLNRQVGDERYRQRMRSGPSPKEQRKAHCQQLREQVKQSKDDLNTYRYNEAIIRDAQRRKKEADDALFSDCFDPAYQ